MSATHGTLARQRYCTGVRAAAMLCAALIGILGSAMRAQAAPKQVPLTVTELAGLARTASPVTTGVPFAPGELKTGDGLRLLDDQGREIDLQTAVTAWHADGSIRCVLLDFQTDVAAKAARKFMLEYGTGVERQAARKPLKVEEKATGEVVINTGAAAFTLSPKKLLASVRLDLNNNGAPGYETEAIDQAKPEVWAVDDKGVGNGPLELWRVQVEEAGSQKVVVVAEGEYAGAKQRIHTKLRIYAYAGQPYLRVIQFVNNFQGRMQADKLGPYVTLPIAGGLTTASSFSVKDKALAAAGESTSGKKGTFWAGASNDKVGVTFVAADTRIDPEDAQAQFLPDGSATLALSGPGGRMRYGTTVSFVIAFHKAGTYAGDLVKAWGTVNNALYAIAPAKWYCDSKILGDLLPLDEVATFLPDYASKTRDVIARGNPGGMYYNNVHCAAMLFAMSADPQWLGKTYAVAQADYFWTMQGGGISKGFITPGADSVRHIYARGGLEPFYLTGDRLFREFGLWVADGTLDKRPAFEGHTWGVTERNLGFSLVHMTSAYLATLDPRYLAVASDLVKGAERWQEPTSGGFIRSLRLSDTEECPDSAVGGSPWMTGSVMLDGLIEYHEITGDARAAKVIGKAGHWLAYQGWLPAHGKNQPTFGYLTHRDAFDATHFYLDRFGATPDITWMCVAGMPYAAYLTGDKNVLEVARRGLSSNGPGGATEKWMGQSYRMTPHFPYHYKMAIEKWGEKWGLQLNSPMNSSAGEGLAKAPPLNE